MLNKNSNLTPVAMVSRLIRKIGKTKKKKRPQRFLKANKLALNTR